MADNNQELSLAEQAKVAQEQLAQKQQEAEQPEQPLIFAPAQQNANKLVESGLLSPETAAMFPQEPEEVPLPSNEEAQAQTELVMETFPKDRMENLKRQGFSDIQAKQYILDEIDRKDQLKVQQADKQQQEQIMQMNAQKVDLEEQKDALTRSIQIAESRGLPADEFMQELDSVNSQLEEIGAQLGTNDITKSETEIAAETIKEENQKALADQQAQDLADQKAAEASTKDIINQQIGANNAIKKTKAEETEKELNLIQQIEKQIVDQQKELSNFKLEDFVKNQTRKNGVLAGFALILGGISQGMLGLKENPGYVAIQDNLLREFEAQKLGREQKVAMQQGVLNLLKAKLNAQEAATNDQLKKAQIKKINAEIERESLKLFQEQVEIKKNKNLASRLASAEGLTREEVFQLDPKVQDKAVYFKDGKARFANNSESAKKLRNEIIPDANKSIKGLQDLKNLGKQFLGGAIDITKAKPMAENIVQSLKGSLRLELFGPGVMTDQEQKLADKIIGDPTKLFSLTEVEMVKLDTLQKKIIQSTKFQLRANGIELPKSNNEKKIDQLIKNNPKLSKEQAMSALMEKGFWEEEELGF